MKKMILNLVFLSLVLTGCSNKVQTGIASNREDGNALKAYGDLFFTSEVKVEKGVVNDAKTSVTYSPMVWARVSDSDLDKVDTLEVSALPLDGSSEKNKVHFAKYIQIGDYQFTGYIRSEDVDTDIQYMNRNELVRYRYNSIEKDDDALSDLNRYLEVGDSGTTNYMSNVNWYVQSVLNDKVKILKNTGTSDKPTFEDSGIKLSFPNDKRVKNENSDSWSTSVNAIANYFKGKRIDFKAYVDDEQGNQHASIKQQDGSYYYNDQFIKGVFDDNNYQKIDNCSPNDITLNNLINYFTSFNYAFSRVEYQSF